MSHNTDNIRTLASLGTKAIMVRCEDGIYEAQSAATQESWEEVIDAIAGDEDSVQVDTIIGWGEYTHAVHITVIDADTEESMKIVYFVG